MYNWHNLDTTIIIYTGCILYFFFKFVNFSVDNTKIIFLLTVLEHPTYITTSNTNKDTHTKHKTLNRAAQSNTCRTESHNNLTTIIKMNTFILYHSTIFVYEKLIKAVSY